MNESSKALILGMCQKLHVNIKNIYVAKGLCTISEEIKVEADSPTLCTISEEIKVEADIVFAERES